MATCLRLSSRRTKWKWKVDVWDENDMRTPFVLVAKQQSLVYTVVTLKLGT
jgi:hypothetical protein